MNQLLQLRHDAALDSAPGAWFLPGASAERWLEELARSGLASMETRLFVVPVSIEDRSPAGLLVVPVNAGCVVDPPAGIACRMVGRRLFVPLDAALYPQVADSELNQLCALPVSFYHPVFGLSGFEEEALLRVSDLIEAPEEKIASWNSARPGAPGLPELSAIVLLQPPSIGDIFGGAEDDIGTNPLADLPPAPDEPADNPLSKAGRKISWIFAKGTAEIMRHVPHTGVQRTWLNDVEDWAKRQISGVNSQLEQLRNKELHRLLHLLDTDPEAGLRQAIPLSGFANRGVTPPSSRLGNRSLNFDPSRLGGRPADFWNVPSDLQNVLRRRYREMADREMQLGRHRRAAYIYAELLGDLVSAANAFKQGRLYREAALLYEEHLRNPLEAARCLAEGGLLAEAIERYEKLGRWMDVADLYERMGDEAAAREAIQRVIQESLGRNDILTAAKLTEERLHEPDEALRMLLDAWPASHQAASCTGAAFQLMSRLARHETALERMARFRREPLTDSLAMPLLSALGNVARDYPHELVRHHAADFSRVLIARQLQRPGLGNDETGRLLEHLVRLAPQDRLMSRDANRYLATQRSAALRAHRVEPPHPAGKKPVVHRRIELPRQIRWSQLRGESHWFYVLGTTPKRLTVLRGIWEGQFQSLSWDCPAEAVKNGFVFEPMADRGHSVALARADGTTLPQKRFPAADLFFNQECIAGTPLLPPQAFPLTIGEDALWSVHLAGQRAIVSCYDKMPVRLQRTIDVTDELLNNAERTPETRLSLAVLGNTFAVALGNRLVLTRGDGGLKQVALPGQAIGLVATIPNTRRGVAVMLNHGAVLHWVGSDGCIELDRDIQSPKGAFIPGGPLVLVSGTQGVLLEADSRGVHSVVRSELASQRIAGICSTTSPAEFAVLNESGELIVYRMPR